MMGDVLVVSVTEDEFVGKLDRPVFPLVERMAVIRALAIVDEVISCKNSHEAILKVKPHIFVKGSEYRGHLKEQAYCDEQGVDVRFTHGKVYSSTALLSFYNDRNLAPKDQEL